MTEETLRRERGTDGIDAGLALRCRDTPPLYTAAVSTIVLPEMFICLYAYRDREYGAGVSRHYWAMVDQWGWNLDH